MAQVVKRWHSFQGTVFLVPVVEGDGDGGLGDASLAVLVDQHLQAFSSDLKHESNLGIYSYNTNKQRTGAL